MPVMPISPKTKPAPIMGHNVPHFHLHLLPRYPGTPREFWGLRVDEWPGAPHGGEAEIADLCDRLRAGLGTL